MLRIMPVDENLKFSSLLLSSFNGKDGFASHCKRKTLDASQNKKPLYIDTPFFSILHLVERNIQLQIRGNSVSAKINEYGCRNLVHFRTSRVLPYSVSLNV